MFESEHAHSCLSNLGVSLQRAARVLFSERSPGCFFFSPSCSQVGNYKRAVKRFDDGHRLCNDLMGCLQERAKIEKAYGDQLTAWSKRWRQLIEKGRSHSCSGGGGGATRWPHRDT